MRAVLRADRERMLERLREEGRKPVFGGVGQPPPDEPAPAPAPEPEPEPAPEPAPEPEPEPTPAPEPALTPASAPVRPGWLRRLFAKRGSARE